MLSILFARFWPIFIPLGFYVLWLFILSRRAGEDRKRVAEHLRSALLFWAVLTGVALMIGSFIWWGVSQQEGSDGNETAPSYHRPDYQSQQP
jgi:hypothetical protein